MSNRVLSASVTLTLAPGFVSTPVWAMQSPGGVIQPSASRSPGAPFGPPFVFRYPKLPGDQLPLPLPTDTSFNPLATSALGSNVWTELVSWGLQIITGGTLQMAKPNPAVASAPMSPELNAAAIGVSA